MNDVGILVMDIYVVPRGVRCSNQKKLDVATVQLLLALSTSNFILKHPYLSTFGGFDSDNSGPPNVNVI